ncbi:hypothetical protein FXN63_04325 [Pigmentiphaga aceris]|uniref:Uncharacterized protein n=1 Tax=Pigmentiphaga aceris TaxID=1940612 RepID=A0A5C0ATY9_9BURK|nr:hypothetical protein [Pigmentiphaga aceris]QEI05146.1 hypothetical protein FXN63_04325 [Pigmentiphaga aceris]
MDLLNIGATRGNESAIRTQGNKQDNKQDSQTDGKDAFATSMAAAQSTASSTPSVTKPDVTPKASSGGFNLQTIEAGVDAWMEKRRNTQGIGADFLARVEGTVDAYRDVLKKADAQGGFSKPKEFLQGLNSQELHALQTMHSLADPINVSALSEEGALNLLLPQTMARDLDGNGLTSVGAAQLLIFPPAHAPQSFKDSWEQAMADAKPGMRLNMEMKMWMAAGGGLDVPGAAVDGRVAYDKPGFDYLGILQQVIDSTRENLKYQSTAAQREFGQDMIDTFQRVRDQLIEAKETAQA